MNMRKRSRFGSTTDFSSDREGRAIMQLLRIKCCILGDTGSGKTTLIRSLLGNDHESAHPINSKINSSNRVDVYSIEINQKECKTTAEILDVGRCSY